MPEEPNDHSKPDDPSTEPKPEPDTGAEAEKWKALARKHETESKKNASAAAKLAELEAAGKTEAEKLTEAATVAEARAAKAEARALRAEIAHAKGLTPAQAKRLVGDTQEELEADADELVEAFGGKKNDPPPPGKPRENLRGGGEPGEEPEETDPAKLAAMIRRN